MPLVITDEVLAQTGLTAREAGIEIACRLFDAGRLTLPEAAKFSGLSRVEIEAELGARGIAVYRPTVAEVAKELESLRRAGA